MTDARRVLAFDLGASSGRAIVGELADGRLSIREIHRFSNDPVQVADRLHWDILRLYHEIKQGLLKAKLEGLEPDSIGIDSWAVDFGLIGRDGGLLGNPYHYRDAHTAGVMEELIASAGAEKLFAASGIQFLPFNTIYQLAALNKAGSPLLAQAETLLMIPDLLRYFLTGVKAGEFTNASTTQLLNPHTREWDGGLLELLGLNASLLPRVLQPGAVVGPLRAQVREELGLGPIPVVAVGEHDTASAVVGVPADRSDFAYLSCGTWSLLGTELDRPVLSGQALDWNFTNEGGVDGTYRLLRNIMGLWLVQECKRVWEKEGFRYTHAELVGMAERAPAFGMLVDPDDASFLNPPHMPKAIAEYCRRTGQPEPADHGQTIRCVLESLALKYRLVLERTEKLAGRSFAGLHMVGGGIQNELLCRFTAGAIGRPVWAGPTEASAIGNVVMQLRALGGIGSLAEGRALIRASFDSRTYEPEAADAWNGAYAAFLGLLG